MSTCAAQAKLLYEMYTHKHTRTRTHTHTHARTHAHTHAHTSAGAKTPSHTQKPRAQNCATAASVASISGQAMLSRLSSQAFSIVDALTFVSSCRFQAEIP